MIMLAIPFPDFNPIALEIGPVAIKWYGLAYMAGLLLGWMYIRRLLSEQRLWPRATPPFDAGRTDDLLLYMTIGVVLGGRLGFVLLYEAGHYISHPSEIAMVWKGGMAFHGALVGCGLQLAACDAKLRVGTVVAGRVWPERIPSAALGAPRSRPAP